MNLFGRRLKEQRECEIPAILADLAAILDRFEYSSQRDSLLELSGLYDSDPAQFRHDITTNKYYWLGMGTIADICFGDSDADAEFRALYHRLATECERSGFRSAYSFDVASVFGRK